MNAEFDITGLRLESDRLILREWVLSDADDLFEYASVPGVGEMAGWPHHKDKEESLGRVKRFIEEKHTFAIVYKENNKVIGSLGIEKYGSEDKLSEFFEYKGRELGYVLSKDYWGRGLMPEALQLVINYLFKVLNYDFLLCGHYDKNNQSQRVQEKCGFAPYRKLVFDTNIGTHEPGVLRLLVNPNKNINFVFSHPETLIIKTTDKELIDRHNVIIENDTLYIEKMNPSMYYDIYRNSLDEDNRKYVPDEVFETLEEASEVVDQIIQNYETKNGPFVYSVIRKADNMNLGYVQLIKIDEGWEIGYHIAKIFTGNGYATNAVKLFLEYIKNSLDIKEVYGIALASNKASRRVLEKCGFKLYFEDVGMYQGKKRKMIKSIYKIK